MENELTVKEQGFVSLVKDKGLGDVLKPLTKEIHLLDTYIAGTTLLDDTSVLDIIKVGDELSLQREQSMFDDNAIVISTKDDQELGYVPEKDNVVFARLMDAGKLIKAKVTKITDRGSLKQISIALFLVDF